MSENLPRSRSGRLAGMLREQLNEMMAAANGLGDLLSADEKGRQYLAVINRRLAEQMRLTHHLELDYKLSSEDEVRLRLRPVDLVEMCRELMAQVESVTHVLPLRVEFSTELKELLVSADRARLEDMLLCLISNAVKAVGENGVVSLTLEKRGDRVVFLLADNGSGLDPDTLAEIFEQKCEDDDIPEDMTMGMGLPLARKIAGLHGGVIIANSGEGEGTRIAVALPCREPEPDGGLHSDWPVIHEEGWNKVLVELSDSLPARSFMPEELD